MQTRGSTGPVVRRQASSTRRVSRAPMTTSTGAQRALPVKERVEPAACVAPADRQHRVERPRAGPGRQHPVRRPGHVVLVLADGPAVGPVADEQEWGATAARKRIR